MSIMTDDEKVEVLANTEIEKLTPRNPKLLATTFYQGNPEKNHKLCNIVSTERCLLHG